MFFFQAEDGIRDLVRSRGLGDVYKRQLQDGAFFAANKMYGLTFKERTDLPVYHPDVRVFDVFDADGKPLALFYACLLYTSDAADERSSVDLGGRRIIKTKITKKKTERRLSELKPRRRPPS